MKKILDWARATNTDHRRVPTLAETQNLFHITQTTQDLREFISMSKKFFDFTEALIEDAATGDLNDKDLAIVRGHLKNARKSLKRNLIP